MCGGGLGRVSSVASVSVWIRYKKHVGRSRRLLPGTRHLAFAGRPGFFHIRESTARLHGYTNTELLLQRRKLLDMSRRARPQRRRRSPYGTESLRHQFFFSLFLLSAATFPKAAKCKKDRDRRDTSFTKALHAPSRFA